MSAGTTEEMIDKFECGYTDEQISQIMGEELQYVKKIRELYEIGRLG